MNAVGEVRDNPADNVSTQLARVGVVWGRVESESTAVDINAGECEGVNCEPNDFVFGL